MALPHNKPHRTQKHPFWHWLLPLFFALCPHLAVASAPNIILIFTDDQGYADLGSHGIRSDVLTPHIDKLAQTGATFTDGYITAPQCSPSRAGLMAGRYQQRFGFDSTPDCPLPLDVPILAERLQDLGYRTGMVGKWHLEPSIVSFDWAEDNIPGYVRKPGERVPLRFEHTLPYQPGERGFDDFFAGYVQRYWSNYNLEGEDIEPQHLTYDHYRMDIQTDAALSFLRRQENDRPFFLYLAYYGPHVPMVATDEDLALFDPSLPIRRRVGLAMIHASDRGVGRIVELLQERGMSENTLIVFSSDNGAPLLMSNDQEPISKNGWDGSLNEPLFGEKGMLAEGGIRVPFLMHWPARIPEGMVINDPVITLDLTPTFIEAAGGKISPSETDGVSLLPLFNGEVLAERNLYWSFWRQRAIRRGPWKLLRLGPDKTWLFNLEEDAPESIDRSADYPALTQSLSEKLDQWLQSLEPSRLQIGQPIGPERDWYETHFPKTR